MIDICMALDQSVSPHTGVRTIQNTGVFWQAVFQPPRPYSLRRLLDHESSLLTTMNTPIGRYRWLKLPFGIKSAPEMYPRAMDEMLEGIDHAYAIMDDILVAGRDISHNDSVLEKVLYRAKSYNLKLNFDKVRVRKQQVPYVGHIISAEGLKPDPEKVRATKEMLPRQQRKMYGGSWVLYSTWLCFYLC